MLPKATCFVFFPDGPAQLNIFTGTISTLAIAVLEPVSSEKHGTWNHGFLLGITPHPQCANCWVSSFFFQNWSSKKMQSFVQIFLSIIALHDLVNFCIVQAVSNTVRRCLTTALSGIATLLHSASYRDYFIDTRCLNIPPRMLWAQGLWPGRIEAAALVARASYCVFVVVVCVFFLISGLITYELI